MSPSKLNLTVTRDRLGIYTLRKVCLQLAPPESKIIVLWYVLSRRSRGCLNSFKTIIQNRFQNTYCTLHKVLTISVPQGLSTQVVTLAKLRNLFYKVFLFKFPSRVLYTCYPSTFHFFFCIPVAVKIIYFVRTIVN